MLRPQGRRAFLGDIRNIDIYPGASSTGRSYRFTQGLRCREVDGSAAEHDTRRVSFSIVFIGGAFKCPCVVEFSVLPYIAQMMRPFLLYSHDFNYGTTVVGRLRQGTFHFQFVHFVISK